MVASLLVLLAFGAYTLLMPKTVTLKAESEVVTCHLPDGTQVSLVPHSSLSYQEDDCRKVEMEGCIGGVVRELSWREVQFIQQS